MTGSNEVVSDHEEGGQEEVELQDQPNGKRCKKSHVCKDFEELESDDPMSTGLKMNYKKTMMVPINISDERLETLSRTFGCGKAPYLSHTWVYHCRCGTHRIPRKKGRRSSLTRFLPI